MTADHDCAPQVAAFGRCVACTAAQLPRGPDTADEARDAALARTAGAAPGTWIADARNIIGLLASSGREFSSDEVWSMLRHPPEPRALGAVMRQAAADGLIRGTGRTRPSTRPDCHARPVAIWVGSPQNPQAVVDELPL